MNNKSQKEARRKKQEAGRKTFFAVILLYLLLSSFSLLPTSSAFAQNLDPAVSNPSSPKFRLVVCDGPAKANVTNDPNYVPCDFRGLMIQVRHLVNVMIVLGVLAAIVGFSWAGGLYITGVPGNISRAHEIFRKVATGFIIMLVAWFIVYQILSWVTGNPGLGVLLGSP